MAAPQEYTEAQRDAICRAYDLLGEHFDHSVIVVDTHCVVKDEQTEENEDGGILYWTINGGHSAACGMLSRTLKRLLD